MRTIAPNFADVHFADAANFPVLGITDRFVVRPKGQGSNVSENYKDGLSKINAQTNMCFGSHLRKQKI